MVVQQSTGMACGRAWRGIGRAAAIVALAAGLAGTARAQMVPGPPPAPPGPPAVPAPPPGAALPPVEPIVSDEEFDAAIPLLDPADDPELSQPLETIEAFERRLAGEAVQEPAAATDAAPADRSPAAPTGDAPMRDAELAKPLPPLGEFTVEPVEFADGDRDPDVVEVGYLVRLEGLEPADAETTIDLRGEFEEASALYRGKGKAANLAQLTARLTEDSGVLKRLLASEGWYDAQVTTRIDRSEARSGQPLTATMAVAPGQRFVLSTITIDAAPTVPPGLIERNLALRPGEPLIAARVQGAEAQVAVALPQHGYPFAEVGQRDVLLDQDSGNADYTLPVAIGPRATIGGFATEGVPAFGTGHIATIARFGSGDLYDSRMVDDLRQALIATGLFDTVAVSPVRTGQPGPDGTELVTLNVIQQAGPPRTIAASGGYGTGEGLRTEASWTHRNLFPPEGALILRGAAGTREQSVGATFRRSNAGRRDRAIELVAEGLHASYDAYSAISGRLAARISYDSTPLWQKRLTYAIGGELIGTAETTFDPATGARRRKTYGIAGLTGQLGFDTSDDLLNPTRGVRITALVQPEAAWQASVTPYVRARVDGSTYYQVRDGVVLAARARVGTIQGIARDRLAPSRRFYAGGGGSVRGFGFQQLGPRDLAGAPLGGRSLIEGAVEARYRFGNYGVVGFVDGGQVYDSLWPRFTDLRLGVGIGARMYTNFGPIRVDLATPLARRPGEGRFNVYVSIGQAF